MKKIITVILAFALAASLLSGCSKMKELFADVSDTDVSASDVSASDVSSSDAGEATLSKEAAAAFDEELTALMNEYGEGTATEDGIFLTGVPYVKLVDFDSDGQFEMLAAYYAVNDEATEYVNTYRVYAFKDGKAEVVRENKLSNFGNGDAPGIKMIKKDGTTYMVENNCGAEINYLRLNDIGIFVTDLAYTCNEYEDDFAVINDEQYSFEDAAAKLEEFESGAEIDETMFYDYENSGVLGNIVTETNAVIEQIRNAK